MDQGIQDEPEFYWWVPFTLHKRDRIIAAVNYHVCKSSHKYGIKISTSVEDTKSIDRKKGTTYCKYAISREMYNVGIALNIL